MHHHDPDHEPTLEELREALTEEFWDAKYEASQRVWSGNPNQRLVEQARDLAPGRALDVGCGEGADAIWLAGRGWDVTAVDVSTVALDRTAEHAIEADVDDDIDVGVYDAMAGRPKLRRERYDLVTVHFLHVPREDFDDVYRRIAAAVAPGGRLLVVAHHPADVESGVRPSHGPGLLFPPERVLQAVRDVAAWSVETSEAATREQVIDGAPVTVTDTVVRLLRNR
ncbi:methyltransferase domain-containing protein [Nocardioides panacisoli]|uniref:class I SAM-dependent methyltransferase n=1 Tax=Nocardioides panacisoli TaxID=627624 RepID=UPI001C630245|nr:class I SAM-dependent methyltransferase [Nocardioides panacisoli]QYJ02460.1 methyltransferase domain-containing protein [Nocardioides panacisoli]